MASHSSIHTFMEMASGLLLDQPVDESLRPRLTELAQANGLSEGEMELVVEDLAARGIASVAPSFYVASEPAAPPAAPSIPSAAPPLPAGEQPLGAPRTPAPDLPPPPPGARLEIDPRRDAFRQHVESRLGGVSGPSDRSQLGRQLLEEAGEFGLDDAEAGELLCEWLELDVLDVTEPPDSPPEPPDSPPKAPPAASPPPPLPPPAPPAPDAAGRPSQTRPPPAAASQAPPAPHVAAAPGPEAPVRREAAGATAKEASTLGSQPATRRPSTVSHGPAVAAPPASHRAQATPREAYLKYLRKAIPQLRREHISVRSESKLVEQGVAKLGLSEPFATELLREAADELQTPMLSQQSTADDPRFDQFRDRAAMILAENRGVNARSRMLLTAMGGELGLDEEQLDQAMSQLTVDRQGSLEDAKRESFAARLRATLSQMPDKFITAPVQEAILEDGVAYEGLSESAARQVLKSQAAAAEVTVVDRQRARRHVTQLLSERRQQPDQQDVASIREEARLWGLSDAEFQQLYDEFHHRRKEQKRRERQVLTIALAGSCCAVAALVIGGAMLYVRSTSPPADTATSAGERGGAPGGAADHGGTPAADQPPATPAWHDAELLIAMTNLRKQMPPAEQAVVEQAVGSDAETRRAGVAAIIAHTIAMEEKAAAERIVNQAERAAHVEFLEQWFRVEPDAEVLRAATGDLLNALPRRGDPPRSDPQRYEADLQLAAVIAAMIAVDGAPAERSQRLAEAFGQRLGVSLDPAAAAAELQRQCQTELAALLYENLTNAAGAKQGPWEPHHFALSVRLNALLSPRDPGRVERLQLEFLVAVLRAGHEPWEPYEELVRKFAYSEEPYSVSRMLSLMEDVESGDLQRSLAKMLCISTGQVYRGQSADEVAKLVRGHLRGKSAEPGGDAAASARALEFLETAQREIGRAGSAKAMPGQSREIARLARVAALGCLVLAGESSASRFQLLLEDSPPSLEAAPSREPAASMRTYASLRERAHRSIDTLKRIRQIQNRAAAFVRLCNLAEPSPMARSSGLVAPTEPDGLHAERLAEYLTDFKVGPELKMVLESCGRLTAWWTVTLALADRIEAMPGREEQVEQIVFAMLGPVPAPEGTRWQDAMARALRDNALQRLRKQAGGRLGVSPVTLAESYLRNMYRMQLQARVGPDSLGEDDTTASRLATMVRRTAEQLQAAATNQRDRKWLRQVPKLLTAAAAAADDEMQQFVWLQRIWLRVVQLELELRLSRASVEAAQVVADLERSDRAAETIWQQVRDGELALAKMWTVYVEEVKP